MKTAQERTNSSPTHIDVTGHVGASDRNRMCGEVTPVLQRVGDKWSMHVVMALSDGSKRFSELKREIDGISQRMLTHTVRALERDGLISRHVTPVIPPRVDYELTELGRSLGEPVRALGQWAMAHMDRIRTARALFDKKPDEGRSG